MTVPAKSLAPHPDNIRLHPGRQVEQVRQLIEQIGWAQAILVYPHGDGWRILDGHLRANLDPEADVPVLTTDLNEAEADLLLATLDATRDTARFSKDKLQRIVERIGRSIQSNPILEDIQEHIKQHAPPTASEDGGLHSKTDAERDLELKTGEHYDFLVIQSANRREYRALCEAVGLSVPTYRPNTPVMRAIHGKELLNLLC